MDKEEFQKKAKDLLWMPGFDAIRDVFQNFYGGDVEMYHYVIDTISKPVFGGNQYLYGYSLFVSKKAHIHIVTFGLSEMYAKEEALGKERSKWGYEMTVKLRERSLDDCLWMLDVLSVFGRETFLKEEVLKPYQLIPGNGESIQSGTVSKITAYLTVPDTEIDSIQTLYGEVAFIQLVGITEVEYEKALKAPALIPLLIENLKKDYPELQTDMIRIKNYL